MHAFDHASEVPDEPALVVRRFGDTPLRWLPVAAGLHGTSEFDGHLRILGVPTWARFSIGGPWENEGVMSRRMDTTVGGAPSGDRPLVRLEGEISVSAGHTGTCIRYCGSGNAQGHGLRRLLGRLLTPTVARASTDTIAARLGGPI